MPFWARYKEAEYCNFVKIISCKRYFVMYRFIWQAIVAFKVTYNRLINIQVTYNEQIGCFYTNNFAKKSSDFSKIEKINYKKVWHDREKRSFRCVISVDANKV